MGYRSLSHRDKMCHSRNFISLLAEIQKQSRDPPRIVIQPKNLFIVKRNWAIQAEKDRNDCYYDTRRTKCIESLRDLKGWVKENVMAYKDGELFQTLLGSDELFTDPGLETHPESHAFLEKTRNSKFSRKSNSLEIGFDMFARSVILDVFKEKAQGLVLRNFEQQKARNNKRLRTEFGRFMDRVLAQMTKKEDSNAEYYYEIDRESLEKIKNRSLRWATENKAGTYELNVYAKDLRMYANKWLIRLLNHTSVAWDNYTMMRFAQKRLRNGDLRRNFTPAHVEEYYDTAADLRKLTHNPSILKPGPVSLVLCSLLNTGAYWDEDTLRLEPEEIWNENNRMSAIKKPVSVDMMLQILTVPIR